MCPYVFKFHFIIANLSDHFHLLYKLLALQHLHSWETVCAVAALGASYLSYSYPYGRIRLFDRYSNSLLVSLNNRISIRDTYATRGVVVGCQDIVAPSIRNSSHSGSTTETMIAETEKPQEDLMRQLEPIPEAGIEWAFGESYGRYIIVLFLIP